MGCDKLDSVFEKPNTDIVLVCNGVEKIQDSNLKTLQQKNIEKTYKIFKSGENSSEWYVQVNFLEEKFHQKDKVNPTIVSVTPEFIQISSTLKSNPIKYQTDIKINRLSGSWISTVDKIMGNVPYTPPLERTLIEGKCEKKIQKF
jgi:hypothetical protein